MSTPASAGAQPLQQSYRTPAEPTSNGQGRPFTRVFDNTYEVDTLTGFTRSTNPPANWVRGQLYREAMPAFVGPSAVGYFMSDPSDPNRWVTATG